MNKIKELLGDNISALFYGIIITIITMILYVPNNYVVIGISTVFVSLIYFVMNKLSMRTRKAVCSLLYLLTFFIAFICFRLNIAGTNFYMWLLTGYDYNVLFIPYIALLFAICILFFGVSSYYFTTLYFRGYIMIFMLLIPIALYYKTIESVPVIYIMAVVVSVIYLYIVMQQKRNLLGKNVSLRKDNNLLVTSAFRKFCIALFAIIILVVAIVPKSEVAERREEFDEFISMNPFSNRNINAIGTLTEKSAAAAYGYLNQTKVLYTLNAYEPLYLRRSSYEKFKGDYFENESVAEYSDWKDKVKTHNMRVFYENMTALYDKYPDIFEMYKISKDDIPNVTEESMTAIITPKNFNTNYFVSTVRTFEIDAKHEYLRILKNNKGALYFEGKPSIGQSSYQIEYYRDIARQNESIIEFSNKFTIYDYMAFIRNLEKKENESGGEYEKWLEEIFTELSSAMRYCATNRNYSERLTSLAEEITSLCQNDYEKALALEEYFRKNNYVYNISYEPDEPGIEYFVFNSKEGSCREYATAMTLMAQSVGLCARYTEGFVADKRYNDGSFYITAGDSHAYVEIYMPGYGFTVFEPTVSSNRSDVEGTISDTISRLTGIIEMTKDNFIYFVIAGIVSFIFILLFKFVLLDILKDLVMVTRCKRSKQSVIVTYRYIQKMIASHVDKDVETMTPIEVRAFYKEKFDIDISVLTDAVEKTSYGGEKGRIDNQFIKELPKIRKKIREY